MFRTILSYSVLVLIPAVSLGIAVGPYVFVSRKSKVETNITFLAPLTLRGERDTKIASQTRNDNVGVSWKQLWLAFAVGLVGNVGWIWLFDSLMNDKIAMYLFSTNDDGILFAFFLYSFFLLLTPFIFFKLKYGHFTKRQVLITILLTLVTIVLVAGVWVLLFAIAIRGIFERLN